jgi:hypothetical protein
MANLATEIEELERDGWAALSGPDGAAFYETVMADDGLMVFPGSVMDRNHALDAIRGASPWSSFELVDLVVTGDRAAALITYRAKAVRSGSQPYEAVMSSVYVARDGRWQLLLHQQSPG